MARFTGQAVDGAHARVLAERLLIARDGLPMKQVDVVAPTSTSMLSKEDSGPESAAEQAWALSQTAIREMFRPA